MVLVGARLQVGLPTSRNASSSGVEKSGVEKSGVEKSGVEKSIVEKSIVETKGMEEANGSYFSSGSDSFRGAGANSRPTVTLSIPFLSGCPVARHPEEPCPLHAVG